MEDLENVKIENRPNDQPQKWLQYLYYIGAAALAVSVLHSIPGISGTLTVWCSRILSILAVGILYQLRSRNERYRKAVIFGGIGILGGLLVGVGGALSTSALGLLMSICSLIGTYQEYHAHSELVGEKDEKLSKSWASLFTWELLVGIAVSLISTVAVVAAASMGGGDGIVSVLTVALVIPEIIIKLLYLKYLKAMLDIYTNK